MAPAKQHSVRKRKTGTADGTGGDENLPYRIELWDGATVNRVLALAGNANLARAIYSAAASEYPGRTIVLSRGPRIIARNTPDQGSGE